MQVTRTQIGAADANHASACLHNLAAHGLYVHSIPGRLRLEVPGLLNNPLRAQKLELSMQRLPGVTRVDASPATGRLLVQYDQTVDGSEVLARLHETGSLSVCCGGKHFASPNSLVSVALEQVAKLGVKLLLGI